MGAESSLTFSTSQLLAELERAVGVEAPPSTWLHALAERDAGLLESATAAARGTPIGSGPRSGAEAGALTRDDVAGLAVRRAASEGRTLGTALDLASALLAMVAADQPAPPSEVVPQPRSHGPDTAYPSSPAPAAELSFSADELVRSLAPAPAGLHVLLAALGERHLGLVEPGDVGVDVHDVAAAARARVSAGDPGPTWDRGRLAAAAAARAASAGRTLAAPADVVAVLLGAAEPLVTEPTPVPDRIAGTVEIATAAEPVPPATDSTPAVGARTFRVFVSSTFSDFVAERDALRRRVWPRLRAYCAAKGARFQEVDLRWGVSEEAAIDQQTMNICLGEVERCHATSPRPSFLVLVGDRYGWLPPPPQIPAGEWDQIVSRLDDDGHALLRRWYCRDDNATPPEYRLRPRTGEHAEPGLWAETEARLHGLLADAVTSLELDERRRRVYLASATEQEIAIGALGAEHPDQVVCFVRDITGHRGAGPVLRDFVDADEAPIAALKDLLRRQLGDGQVLEETVSWTGEAPDLDEAYLIRFTERVYAKLEATIAEELANPLPRPGDGRPDDGRLDAEGRAHRAFAENRLEFFTGRADELATIRRYLRGDSARPLVLHGEGGSGKSALMAAAARDALQHPGTGAVIARYVGATPASSDGRSLLHGICRELARCAGEQETNVPSDYDDLVADFRERLGRATGNSPIVVLVDSLDQLSGTAQARSLSWVPVRLPDHARLIVSSRPGDALTALRERAERLEVTGLTATDGAELLDKWLAHGRRTLQPAQRQHVLHAFESSAGNPLYLRLAFGEVSRWNSDDGQPPEPLATGLQGLIRDNLFHRLEREEQHGRMLVARTLGYLAASRYGLAEDELLDLLSRDVDVYAWFLGNAFHIPPDLRDLVPAERIEALRSDPSRHAELRDVLGEVLVRRDGPRLPVVLWSRLYHDLAPYLTTRQSEGGDLLAFHHRELDDAARVAYAPDDLGRELHSRLGDFFRDRADPRGDRSWTVDGDQADVRGLGELPHHLTAAERWDDLEDTLTDFSFLEQKAAKVGVVARGKAESREALYTGVFQLQEDFEEALRDIPGGEGPRAARPLVVTAVDFGDGLVVRCPRCNTAHAFREEWRDMEIDCPSPECAGRLKINPFVVERRAAP